MTEAEASVPHVTSASVHAALKKKLAATQRLLKALDAAGRAGVEALPEQLALSQLLEDHPLTPFGLAAEGEALRSMVADRLDALRTEARHRLLLNLRAACDEMQLPFERLGERPLELRLGPLTVVVDLDRGHASLRYAREEIATASAKAPDILDAHQAALDHIRGGASPAPAFFQMLRMAWHAACVVGGLAPDARVDLVDLCLPLATLRIDPKVWRRTRPNTLAPFPRYLLAYQLQRLRRERCLQHDGWRLELGAATGGSTRNKKNVLFVPAGASDGQYYLSIRFVRS